MKTKTGGGMSDPEKARIALKDAYLKVLDVSLSTMIKMAEASGLGFKEGSGLIEEAFQLMAVATTQARKEQLK